MPWNEAELRTSPVHRYYRLRQTRQTPLGLTTGALSRKYTDVGGFFYETI